MAELVRNPKARRDYQIVETLEAGLVLRGTEVKALRAGLGQIAEAYATIHQGEAWLENAYIGEYSHGNRHNHPPRARRKLLLHKAEIRKLAALADLKSHALVPLALYWKNGKIKVALAVGKSKARYDHRQDLKRREADRELKRAALAKQQSPRPKPRSGP